LAGEEKDAQGGERPDNVLAKKTKHNNAGRRSNKVLEGKESRKIIEDDGKGYWSGGTYQGKYFHLPGKKKQGGNTLTR